jgi:gluconate 2-dehydrogenase alpha chain
MSKRAPVVVIGLGPAGIMATRVISAAGLPVLALQASAGPDGRSHLVSPAPTVRRTATVEATRAVAAQAGADRIGGSKHLAAPQSYRLTAQTFRLATALRERYGADAIPADADPIDWPVDVDELAEYYRRVEELVRVGTRAPSAWTRRMAHAARALGLDAFDAPAAASTDLSGLLDGSTASIVQATALAVTTNTAGDATGVEYLTADGDRAWTPARAVVIAGSVVPSIRLLLLSGLDAGGLVGRHFLSHNSFVVSGFFPGTDLARDRSGPAVAVAVSEYEDDRFDHTGLGFLGGSILQAAMTGPRTPERSAGLAGALPADFGDASARVEWIRHNEGSVGAVWAQPDQLPRATNRIDLDPTHRDPLGRPVARITLDLADDDRARAAFLSERMAQWLEAAGAERTWWSPPDAQPLGTHLYGGARMGDDPRTSVVDGWGRMRGTPGLVVLGSATFPATAGRGPVQTIEALAWRAADRLVADLA